MTSQNTTGISQKTTTQPTLDQLAGREPMPEEQVAAQTSQVEQQVDSEPSIELKEPLNPMIYRDGKNLILIDGAAIPSNVCVKTGKKASTVISSHLLHPLHPGAWFKRDHNTMIGLSARALEQHRINQALFLALIIMGIVMIPVGIISGIATAIVGLLICFAGLVIRAMNPVWSPSSSKNEIVVRGCGEDFLSFFEEKPQS